MERTPSRIGARAEMEVARALSRTGKHVYLPVFEVHWARDYRLVAPRDLN